VKDAALCEGGMKILHLSCEYPDELRPGTIVTIKRLVACANQFAFNHVISLHRRAAKPTQRLLDRGDHTILCARGSLLPFLRRAFIEQCTQRILSENLADGFDLVHAHKLTTEGCIALRLKAARGLNYCVSIRATDFAIMRQSPHRHAEFVRVLDQATHIAVIAPWMVARLSEAFHKHWTAAHERKLVLLGNVVDGPLLNRPAHNSRYVMPIRVIRSQLSRKNVLRTLKCVRSLRAAGHDIQLDVMGSGSGSRSVAHWLHSLDLKQSVSLLGEVPNAEVIERLSTYKAVALFSFPETFGLVYLEALRAGIPLLHARRTGVDGLFPGFDIGVSAPHDSERLIGKALLEMEQKHSFHRSEVRRLQKSGALHNFGSEAFAQRLARELYETKLPQRANEPECVSGAQSASEPEQQWI
jgi:glycosyltransferase involved in cell wall biosynthesis